MSKIIVNQIQSADGTTEVLNTLSAVNLGAGISVAGLPGAGAVLQVVSSTLTSAYTFSTAVAQTYTAIPNLSATITPSSTSSKILLFTTLNFGQAGAHAVFRWVRGNTAIAVGDAAGSRTVGSFVLHTTAGAPQDVGTHHFLDTPSTTSEITYALHGRCNDASTSVYINRSSTDTDSALFQRTVSTITVMEIAG